MRDIVPLASVSRRIPDAVVVVGMLTAMVMAIFVMTIFFAVVRRSSKQAGGGTLVSGTTPVARSTPMSGGD